MPGAKGIGIIYDDGEGSNAPTDNMLYLDQSKAIAQGASTAPADKKFLYWVVQKWNGTAYVDTDVKVYPGDTFKVLKADAREQDITDGSQTEDVYKTYTIQVRAEYGNKETPKETYIDWYQNDQNPSALLHEDKNLQINQAVDIYTLTDGNNIPSRTGYKFLGWARMPEYASYDADNKPVGEKISYYEVTEDDLYLKWVDDHYETAEGVTVTQVAADERMPYHALYAVWERVGVFYIFHSSDGTVDLVDMAAMDSETYDLTGAVKGGYLYGGYFNTYFNVTDEECIAVAGKGTAATDELYDGSAIYKKVNGKVVRYWTKSEACGADGSALEPVGEKVYYLREIPEAFLGLRAQVVYNRDNNNHIDDLYLITTVDNNIYQEAGFKVTKDNKASLYASFSLQSKYSSDVTKIKAETLNGIGGYVGVWEATTDLMTNADDNSEFSVLPYWITVDGIRVDDTHGTRTFNIGDKTYGNESGSMHIVTD